MKGNLIMKLNILLINNFLTFSEEFGKKGKPALRKTTYLLLTESAKSLQWATREGCELIGGDGISVFPPRKVEF